MSRRKVVQDYGLARSKWKQYIQFHADQKIDENTPHTALLNKDSFHKFLQIYPVVFLKPVQGGKGRGVCKISQQKGRYLLHVDQSKLSFPNKQEMYKQIKNHMGNERYIIQQGVSLISMKDRPIDFRLLLIKKNGNWNYVGTIGKLAARNKIVTNYSRGGRAITIPQVKRVLPNHSTELNKLEEQFEKIGLYMANTHFNYGKMLGLDIAIDRQNKLWILEGNTRPGIKLFRFHQDKDIYNKIRDSRYH